VLKRELLTKKTTSINSVVVIIIIVFSFAKTDDDVRADDITRLRHRLIRLRYFLDIIFNHSIVPTTALSFVRYRVCAVLLMRIVC